MSVDVDVTAEHIARRIASTIDPVFAMIDGWRDVLERELAGPLAGALTGVGAPTAEAFDPVVAALVSAELEQEGSLITGAGFVAAPGNDPGGGDGPTLTNPSDVAGVYAIVVELLLLQ